MQSDAAFALHLKEIDGIPIKSYRTLKFDSLLAPVFTKSFARATDMPYPERSQIHFPAGEHRLKLGFLEPVGNGKRYKSVEDVVRTITINPDTVTHVSLIRSDLKWTVTLSDGREGLDLIKKDFEKLLKLEEKEDL